MPGRVPVLALVAILAGGPAAAAGSGLQAGDKAPLFSCPLLADGTDERAVTLTDQLKDGQVTVLSFFHTTCKPCIKEIPRLTSVVKEFEGQPVGAYLVFVGHEGDDTVRAFLKRFGFSLPVLMDRYGLRLGERFGVVKYETATVPQIMVISKNGEVAAAWKGFHEGMEAKLTSLLAKLVKEKKAAPVVGDTISILFTNNTNGLTLPGSSGMGGLARRAAVFKRERKAEAAVLVLDAGDLFPTSPNEERTRQVLNAYGRLGYDAVAIGEAEFVNGLDFLRGVIAEKTVPFISANVKVCGKKPCAGLAKPYKIVAFGKRRVAVYAFMHPGTVGFTPKSRFKGNGRRAEFDDPIPGLKAFVDQHRRDVDLMVVLSHSGVDRDRDIARAVPGLDLIVGGHSQTFLRKPEMEGKTVIVQAASDGQYVGKLVIKFAANNAPLVNLYQLVALNDGAGTDEVMKAFLAGDGE